MHAEAELEGLDAGFEVGVVAAVLGVAGVHLAQQVELETLLVGGDVGWREVADGLGHHVVNVHRGGANGRALVGAGQEARAEELVAALPLGGLDGDEAWKVLVFGAEAVEQPGADAGAREGERPGEELQHGGAVVDAFADHRAHDAEIVDAASDFGEELANGRAALAAAGELPGRLHQGASAFLVEGELALDGHGLAVVAREARLGVESVDVGDAAVHEQEDDALGARGEVWGAGGEGAVGVRQQRD